jgi:hypothetical protein
MWCTKGNADFVGKGKDLGTVEEGKIADIIVVDGDPLADIRSLGKIETVIKNGEIQDIGYHSDYSNPLPKPFEGVIHAYPQPKISSISPVITVEDSGPVTMTVEGQGFVTGSVVQVGGLRVPTERVSATQIKATIPADLIKKVGTYMVLVGNPKPVSLRDPLHEDERSNPKYFMVKFK